MLKYLIVVLIAIFSALVFLYLFVGAPQVFREAMPAQGIPHLYNQPEQKIAQINLAVFYFAPANKTDFIFDKWQEVLQEKLSKLKEFHQLQFQSLSNLSFHVYSEPIIGFEENLFYDTTTTQYGNSRALKSVTLEIEKRVLEPSGDLYYPGFAQKLKDGYLSLMIIYEGVGAAGSDNAALISRAFITEPEYSAMGASILAHEFYHTLGVPEGYEIPSARVISQDIMGVGRFRPLENTFLQRATLQSLGL